MIPAAALVSAIATATLTGLLGCATLGLGGALDVVSITGWA